jgi:RNA polymerase sigma-70 factor (ECF subfamily)
MPTDAEVEKLLTQAGWLRALAVSLLRSHAEADDAIQEVWTAALRSPPDLSRPPRPWLAQVLRNVVRSAARRTRRERDRDREAARLEADNAAPAAEGVLARMETQRRIAELVMALDEPYRTLLLLRYYEGRAAVDIAREQDLPAGTVRWRISEGLRKLRERLDEQADGERERWTRALLPLVGTAPPHPQPRAPGGGATALKLAALATVGAGAAWLAIAKHAPRSEADAQRLDFGHSHAAPTPSDRKTRPEEEQMRNERLKQAAVFFGVVLPSLAAGADGATQNVALEQSVTAACMELHERGNECREQFVDVMLDLHLAKSGKKVTPAERAKLRERAMAEATESGTASVERRRARCKAMASQMGEHHKKTAESKGPALKACYAETDCNARVACLRPILDELLGGETKASPPKP